MLTVAVVLAVLLRRPTVPRPRIASSPDPDPRDAVGPALGAATLLELLAVALGAGAGIPQALAAVGRAVGGPQGAALERAAAALLLGADWDAAWSTCPPGLAAAARVLEPSWSTGVAGVPALRDAAAQVRRRQRAAAREAAARLGVRLVLPLGLCFLPAFVLLGLVPVLLSLAGRLL